jgi:hypothetical protein
MTKPTHTNPNTPANSPAEQPTESPLRLRERVETFTDTELMQLMNDVESKKEVAEELKQQGTSEAIEQRMEELKVTGDVRARWERLRANVANPTAASAIETKAESHFLKQMVEKGGVWAVVGSAAITVLAWLGFKNFKKLRESIKNKGYLRTAIEGAREHPIFATMIAALGIKVGTDAYRYMLDNRETIEEAVGAYAGETGKSIMEATNNVAEKIGEGAGYLKNQSVKHLAKGLAWALTGNYEAYDEETGVVTLPNKISGGVKTLRPPYVIAWQAGVRADGGTALMKKAYSLFIVEDRFDAILRQKNVVDAHLRTANAALFLSAQKGKALLAKGVRPGMNTPESKELEQILQLAIKADPELQKAKPIEVKNASADELDERLKHVEGEMKSLYEQKEVPEFNRTKHAVLRDAKDAEEKLLAMSSPDARKNLKKDTMQKMQESIAAYEQDVHARKVGLGQEYADLLSAKGGSMKEQAAHKLNRVGGHDGMAGQLLETGVRKTEAFGYKMTRNPYGKWVMLGISGYSIAPVVLEGVAGLQSTKEGEAARTAFMNDAGEAVGGFIPVVGEVLDFKAAFTGKDMNGRELDTWQRVTSGAMGTLGTASIAAGFFTGGLSIVGFRALRGAVAARKAVKITKLAQEGIEVASVTKKTLNAINSSQNVQTAAKALDKAKDGAKTLEKMVDLTDMQRKARKIQNFVRNGQRMVQVATYTQLGVQVVSGLTTIAGNAEAFVDNTFESAANVGKTAVDFVQNRTSPKQ